MNPLVELLCLGIRGYQRLSAFGVRRCRFYPTCSEYAVEALRQYGVVRGLSKSVLRLCKCHPWHAGGVDPVNQE